MSTLRIKKIQQELTNPILIKKKENLQYLTGASFDNVEGYLLVAPSRRHSETGGRRIPGGAQDGAIVFFGSGLEKVEGVAKVDRLKNIAEYLAPKSSLNIEYGFTYGEGEYLKLKVESKKCKVVPTKSPVDVLRMVKEPDEIAKIKKSMQIVEKVFQQVKSRLRSAGPRPAITEAELAKFITSSGLKLGAQAVSFPAIVACGTNAAVPHHVPSGKKLKAGESIILDFGFKYKGYCSDFTRTVFLKNVPKKLETAYNQVEKAYNECIDFCNLSFSRVHSRHLPLKGEKTAEYPSPFKEIGRGEVLTGNDVYQKSVDILAEKNLAKYYIHSLGHGTGLEIHELPNLSPNSKDELKDGMVFSIEPGVYIPKLGGIRIEDLVYLKNGKIGKFINVPTKLSSNII